MFKKLFTRTSRRKRKENYTVSSQESQIFLRLRRIFKGSLRKLRKYASKRK